MVGVGRDLKAHPVPPRVPWAVCPPAQAAQGPSTASGTSRDEAAQLRAVPGPHRPLGNSFLLSI